MTFYLEIITPEKVVFKGEVDEVLIPTQKGQIGILPHHVDFLTQLTPGELHIKHNESEQIIALSGGFVEVSGGKVTVLADYAIHSKDIDEAKAMKAKKRAEEILKERISEEDFALAQSELQRSLLELHVAKRRKTRSSNIANT